MGMKGVRQSKEEAESQDTEQIRSPTAEQTQHYPEGPSSISGTMLGPSPGGEEGWGWDKGQGLSVESFAGFNSTFIYIFYFIG